jgi:hypothetical protein
MLFTYTYVPHQMEKMQTFIDFIFFDVWCKAPNTSSYSLDLFEPLPDLWEVMRDFCFADPQPAGAKFFCEHLESIYKKFSSLTPAQVTQFQQWFRDNNDVESVCAADPASNVVRYKDIAPLHPTLYKQVASFFRGLYDKSLLNLAPLRNKIGKIDDHSKAFFEVNAIGKCPFCGLSDLKGIHHTRREAYDHYLPKFRYPFNSINFRNLAPACHECNSTYKLSKDPVQNALGRRKAFYPFSTSPHRIDLKVTLRHADIEKLTPADIDLAFGPANIAEQIETWKNVYGIEERYRGKLLSGDGKAWLEEVLVEWRWHDESAGDEGKAPDEYLRDVDRHTERSPYANTNFLKNSFLRGCKNAGLFEPVVQTGIAP